MNELKKKQQTPLGVDVYDVFFLDIIRTASCGNG